MGPSLGREPAPLAIPLLRLAPMLVISPDSPPASHHINAPLRWALVGALVGALFLLGTYDEEVHAFLTAFWQRLLAAVGLRERVAAMQQGVSGGVTKRLLPAVATYAALYLGLCLLLLRLLLPTRAQWHLTLRLYAAGLVGYAVMVVLTKLAGNIEWAYRLSRHLLDFIVSPLPVAALYVLFRAGFGPAAARA